MKKLLSVSLALISIFALTQVPAKNESTPLDLKKSSTLVAVNPTAEEYISWNTTLHDFGKIQQGVPVEYKFEFSNIGDINISIKDVKTSCGCTAAGYSKDPISPGDATHITASYNAKSAGVFSKTIKVYTDFQEEPFLLKIKGEVVAS